MHLNRYRIEVPNEATVVKIYPLGDIHLGATNCDYDRALAVRDAIARDKHSYWLGMGDVLDSITPSDKRWDAQITDWRRLKKREGDHDESTIVIDQLELAERFFAPIWSKCIGFHSGNHEDAVAKYHFVDVAKKLCRDHDITYLGYTAMTRLEIRSLNKAAGTDANDGGQTVNLDIFSEHGGAGGGTEGNAINQLVKRFEQFRADILLKGHVHRRGISKRSEILWGPAKPIHRTRLAILTGHFLQGYALGATAYPERKSMAPSEPGSTVILIRPRRLSRGGPILDAVNVEALEMFSAA